MKIAVTSASGQLGRAIAKKAIDEFGKDNVIGVARTPEKASDLGIEIRKGDYNSKEDFLLALQGIDVVVLISGMDLPDKRIQQHRNVIAAAKENQVGKIVYTSIFGNVGMCAFDAIINSNRQTEKDIMESGLQYAIGRNGLYIEPDVASLDEYKKADAIINSAGDGKCGYTTRNELADAYVNMIKNDALNGGTYNLFGEIISQQQLAAAINDTYGTQLEYKAISVEQYKNDRTAAHGEVFGGIIAGIYEGIRNGAFDVTSDFKTVTGREHQSVASYLEIQKSNSEKQNA